MKKILLICAVVLGFAFNASAQADKKPSLNSTKKNTILVKFNKAPRLLLYLNLLTLVPSHLF
jgi:hypothetical protein